MEKVDIFDKDSIRYTDTGGRIVENSFYPCFDKLCGGALSPFRRRSDDADFNVEFRHLVYECFGAIDFKTVSRFSDFEGIA